MISCSFLTVVLTTVTTNLILAALISAYFKLTIWRLARRYESDKRKHLASTSSAKR